jgi:hypothetical protein
LLLDASFVYTMNLKTMEFQPAQVSDPGPAQDVAPLSFYHDGIYVSGELWVIGGGLSLDARLVICSRV